MSAPRTRLSEQAITALKWIIMTALIGIIVINIIGTLVSAGLLEGLLDITENPDRSVNTDEALSILGNLGSAAVGGLVGWLTRDYIEASDAADRAAEVAIAEAEEEIEEIEGAPDPSETESVKDESIDEEDLDDEELVPDNDADINPPEPYEDEDGETVYPPDPDYTPVEISEQGSLKPELEEKS